MSPTLSELLFLGSYPRPQQMLQDTVVEEVDGQANLPITTAVTRQTLGLPFRLIEPRRYIYAFAELVSLPAPCRCTVGIQAHSAFLTAHLASEELVTEYLAHFCVCITKKRLRWRSICLRSASEF